MTGPETSTYVYRTETADGALVEVFHENHSGRMVYSVVCECCNSLSTRPDLPGARAAAASRAEFHAGLCTTVPWRLRGPGPDVQVSDRVYVEQIGWDGPFGDATVTGLGVNGIGDPIAAVQLDEYLAPNTGRMTGRDASGTDWRVWHVLIKQLRLLERAA